MLKRDKRIRHRQAERTTLLEAGVRTVCLTGAGNYNRWDTLRLIVSRWQRIEQVAEEFSGPYIYSVTWDRLQRLDLAGVLDPES